MSQPDSARSAADGSGAEYNVLRYCEFRDFLGHLRIEPSADPSGLVMVAAQAMYQSPLPPNWSEHVDEASSRIYFFNKLAGESAWSHPQDGLFRELISEVSSWDAGESIESVVMRNDTHLRSAHVRAAECINQWSGPYAVNQAPEEEREHGETMRFYYNSVTAESCWADPRQALEFDLRQRHSILSECLRHHMQLVAKMDSSDTSDGDDGRGLQAMVQDLWESLGTLPLPLPARQSENPPADVTPPNGAARGNACLPTGEDTVRSSMSFLTARSTAS